ncbi:MAG: GAF domain-containing protein [Bacteroidota bacterium]
MKLQLDRNSIKGRITFLIATFIVLLSITIAFVLLQNSNVLKLGKGVKDITLPLALNGQEILLSLNKASAVQKAYFISRNQNLISQRQAIWEKDIYPSLDVLIGLKKNLDLKDNIERIEKLEELIPKYDELQQEVDDYLSKNRELSIEAINTDIVDSSAISELINLYEANTEDKAYFANIIRKKIDPIKDQIEAAIDPLLVTETEYIYENIGNLNKSVSRTSLILIALSLSTVFLSLLIAYFLFKRLEQSIATPTQLLVKLSQGELTEQLKESSDELNAVILAGNKLNQNLRAASIFAEQIGEGNLEGDFQPTGNTDVLGNALVQMRDRLKKVAEEDQKRNWTVNGLNQLGTILRKDQSDLELLSNNILIFLIKYIEANQGVLFLVNEEDKENIHLEQVAMYAWERTKYLNATIKPGDGIVGQAWQEKEITYLKEIPEDYISIRSGLGKATPKNIVVLPLVYNEQVYGILEIGSFKEVQDFQIEFLESLSETIASTLSSIKMNNQTKLLLEQTQEQAENIRAQEEELRQNLEEMEATQEAMRRAQIAESEN